MNKIEKAIDAFYSLLAYATELRTQIALDFIFSETAREFCEWQNIDLDYLIAKLELRPPKTRKWIF